ncbi:DEKNAAC101176 [Brettanomyces naardenensis]|uniref:RING-type E3 ubiquitin transferase n=1 Tax=Brettanomyces naardenensis TaxID=13370 RepID=A0A448YHF2_BRENA|nr:DEKNAAC101176 [Brettanomyces naardenensis]
MSSSPPADSGYPPVSDRRKIMSQFRDELQESRNALAASYSAGYGNLTGFKLSYGDLVAGRNLSGWPFADRKDLPFQENQKYSILPDSVSRRAAEVWNTEEEVVKLPGDDSTETTTPPTRLHTGAFHQNVTGTIRGSFHRRDISVLPIQMEVPAYYDKLKEYRQIRNEIGYAAEVNADSSSPFADNSPISASDSSQIPPPINRPGNVTADEGTARIGFSNWGDPSVAETAGDATAIDIAIKLNDPGEHTEDQVIMSGVYHRDTGNVVAATRSAKFAGLYAIPQLNLAAGKHFNSSRELYVQRMNQTALEDLEFGLVDQLLEDSANCEYIAYMHVESTDLDLSDLQQIDDELANPVGRPHRPVPKLKITSGLLYSPDCGIVLDLDVAEGPRGEVFTKSIQHVIMGAAILILAQIWLFINQMNATNTPSTLSRLAFWTIATINMADGAFSMIALLCSMIFKDLYLQFVVCAFLAFTCSSIYEMKYNIMVYAAQANERPITWRTALQGTPVDDQNAAAEGEDTEAATTAAETPAEPTVPSPPLDEQSIAAQLYTRYFFGMLLFLFFGLNVTMWPTKQRMIFEYIILTVFNSYWLPQIYRNVIRGSRKSFLWQFMIGTSILRVIPVAYAFLFPNPFYHHNDYKFVIFLTLWLSFQLLILFLQELLGPRFFLPEKYLPKTYNYHPLLTKGDLENGYNFESFDSIDSDGPTGSTLRCKLDCAICMQSMKIPVIDNTGDGDGNENSHSLASNAINLMATRGYMVTPCRHIFHTECLEGWMKYKLQCPVCRNSLPPL